MTDYAEDLRSLIRQLADNEHENEFADMSADARRARLYELADRAAQVVTSAAQPPAEAQPVGVVGVRYDAGLLSDYGGGNVEWWQDYIRSELDRAHDFYTDALAQQPAAVCHCYTTDPTNCIGTDDLAGLDCPCKCHAQQPAAIGEEILVNAAHDVYTLPLQPSGLSSGPRFVVHVPAPEQPAAVDEGFIWLTPAEVQSGVSRVRWAELLIRQLPEDHDGRNSWLMNYGTSAALAGQQGGGA